MRLHQAFPFLPPLSFTGLSPFFQRLAETLISLSHLNLEAGVSYGKRASLSGRTATELFRYDYYEPKQSENQADSRPSQALRTRTNRVEGLRLVTEALRYPQRVRQLIVAPELLRGQHGRSLLQDQRQKGLPCLTLATWGRFCVPVTQPVAVVCFCLITQPMRMIQRRFAPVWVRFSRSAWSKPLSRRDSSSSGRMS
jgi:hypothetical protein